MSDIFEEVEESMRRDKWTRIWARHGWIVCVAGALIIGLVAVNEYVRHVTSRAVAADVSALEAAFADFEARDYEQAGTALEAIATSDARTAVVAGHYLAGLRMDVNGDEAAASDILASVAGSAETAIGKLALIKAAYLKADGASRDEIETLLGPLGGEESAFGMLALELVAAKALEEGDVDFARRQFTVLRFASNAPSGVRIRAGQALSALLPPAELSAVDGNRGDSGDGTPSPDASRKTTNNLNGKTEP